MPNRKEPTTRIRDAEKTVAALKQATIDQLVACGLAGLSIAPLLKKAGVSKGALFHHFASKDALVAAAFEDVLVEFSIRLNRISHLLRSGEIDLDEFVVQTAEAFASDLFIASMEMSLGMRVEEFLSVAAKDSIDIWRESLMHFWTETFDLPGLTLAEQEVHWAVASNTLRGYGFTSSFGHQADATRHMHQGFATFFLTGAVIKPAATPEVIVLPGQPKTNSGEDT